MSEHTPSIKLRREAGTRNVDIEFEGEYVGFAVIGTTRWTTDQRDKQSRYDALAEDAMRQVLAAPDLLAALESLEAVARSHCREGEPGYNRKDVLAYCDEARAAIKRATGEA